jgi:hypothetical protein
VVILAVLPESTKWLYRTSKSNNAHGQSEPEWVKKGSSNGWTKARRGGESVTMGCGCSKVILPQASLDRPGKVQCYREHTLRSASSDYHLQGINPSKRQSSDFISALPQPGNGHQDRQRVERSAFKSLVLITCCHTACYPHALGLGRMKSLLFYFFFSRLRLSPICIASCLARDYFFDCPRRKQPTSPSLQNTTQAHHPAKNTQTLLLDKGTGLTENC